MRIKEGDRQRIEERDQQERVQEFRWTGRVARGKVIEIRGLNGDVHATATDGDQVEVVVVKRGRKSDPATVRVEAREHTDGVTICAVYPDSRSSAGSACATGDPSVRRDGRKRQNDVVVEFTVRVPAGVRFAAHTVNGNVEAGPLRAGIEAHTVNGSVRVVTGSVARASSVNGSVSATVGSESWTEPLEFTTVNGEIVVDLPARATAKVHAETLNGGISSDFPLEVSGRFGPRRLEGTIGGGAGDLHMTTVNGDIRLRKTS